MYKKKSTNDKELHYVAWNSFLFAFSTSTFPFILDILSLLKETQPRLATKLNPSTKISNRLMKFTDLICNKKIKKWLLNITI